jgi:EAL domain-containing protein (putative c-di-GMP-specific phosphodiesterase class I)
MLRPSSAFFSAWIASRLPASRLELEITEAMLISDDGAVLAVLHQLRKLGVRIAIDDCGTGYSSLSYLRRFPFDKIKIDRSFIKDIAEPDGSIGIVQAIVNIAKSRNIITTAEGVETEPQLELLVAWTAPKCSDTGSARRDPLAMSFRCFVGRTSRSS